MQESGTEVQQRIEKEIFRHFIIRENPYADWFAAVPEGPTEAEVKDLVIQLGTFSQEIALIRINRKMHTPYSYPQEEQCGGCGFRVVHSGAEDRHDSLREGEGKYAQWLNTAAALLLDEKKDLKEEIFGSAALASRETEHAIHQMERTYGSGNKEVNSGARFALGAWVGGTGDGYWVSPEGTFFGKILTGIERHNVARRMPSGLTPIPVAATNAVPFLSERIHVFDMLTKAEYGCPACMSGMFTRDWFFGAKIALDAIEIFWVGLDKRRHMLK